MILNGISITELLNMEKQIPSFIACINFWRWLITFHPEGICSRIWSSAMHEYEYRNFCMIFLGGKKKELLLLYIRICLLKSYQYIQHNRRTLWEHHIKPAVHLALVSVFWLWSLLDAYREERMETGPVQGYLSSPCMLNSVPVSDLESMDLDALSGALCLRLSMGLSSVELPNSLFRTLLSSDFEDILPQWVLWFNYTPYKEIFPFAWKLIISLGALWLCVVRSRK